MSRLRQLAQMLADDEGRINRTAFWLFLAGVCAFLVVAFALFPAFGTQGRALPLVTSLLLLYPSYCVIAKRLQDIGIDGQWAMLMVIIAAVDTLWNALGPGLSTALMLARDLWWWISLANGALFLIVGLLPGEAGSNAWGRPPG